MVICLEKLEGNADFHEIVHFLTASTVHYALTQIHATVDAPSTTQPRIKEQIHVTESSSPKNTQSPRQALQEDTQLPQTSVPIPNVADEAIFKEWDNGVVRATTIAASLNVAQASGDRPRCQEAIKGDIAQTRSERASKHSYDSPLLGVNTPRSDEKRLEQHELMDNGSCLGTIKDCSRFGDLKAEKESQKIRKETKGKNFRDETLQDWNTTEQITTAGDTINTASIDVSTTGHSIVSTAKPSTSTAGDFFEDEMMTIADTLVAIRSTRPRTTSVVIRDVEEELRRTTIVAIVQSQDKGKGKMVKPEPTLKNPIKTQIQRDAEIAQQLFEEEQAQFEREQRIAREKATEQEAKNAPLIEQMEDIQERIDADEVLAERFQQEEREQFIIEKKSRLLMEMIAERKSNYGVLGEYQQKARNLELKRIYFKDYYSDNQYAVSIKEDTAYPCLHSQKTTKETSSIRLNRNCLRFIALMEEINNFQQEPDENLCQAWGNFKELLMKCPQHYLTEMQEVILFYNGLGIPTRQILDSRGAIPSKTIVDAKVASKKWLNTLRNGTMEHLRQEVLKLLMDWQLYKHN
ncbi:hypothetical protein Tco_0971355 [Tanacetum coccineum]